MSRDTPPRQIIFEPTAEIFATDTAGTFTFPLTENGVAMIDTRPYDEIRLVFSLWHASSQRSIDLDRAYAELRGCFDPDEEHWTKLAEIEPVVPPYAAGDRFDGWIVLPILGAVSAFTLFGSGFEPRARLQIRASAYLVA
ncbi:MAG: hypothetical protein D6696_12220 [Acidobacteria bacterium]|nr:MAG: hypothetical protein D6696_12220 [Acidobacteriota bacterium]